MIVVQTFNRAGWPADSTMELQDDAAAALLTAVRDYQAEMHVNLHGDFCAAPVGCDRTMAEVVEMRAAWRAPRTSALWQSIGRDKYNMDPGSRAIPSLTSPHLTGFCMDISDNGFLAWLIVNGHRYGLRRTLVRENDLRHFQYFPGTATAALDVTGLDNTTAPTRRKTMTTLFVKQSTGDKKAGKESLWAFAGDAGTPCPGNWIEFTRTTADYATDNDKAAKLAAAHGNAIFLTDAEWNTFKLAYTTAAPAGTLALDPKVLQTLIDAINTQGGAIGAKIDALPAQIDQYADGKKQSS